MTIHASIAAASIDRIVKEIYNFDVIPEVEGRLGKYDLVHMCFTARLLAPPTIEVNRPGALSVQVPVEGRVSIPWGVGMKYHMEASTDVGVTVDGNKLKTEVGKLVFQNLRLGNGCPLPHEVLDLMGPFIHGMIFRGLIGPDGGPMIDIPSIQLPLSELIPPELMIEAPPIAIEIKDIEIQPPGIVVEVGMEGDDTPPAPLPSHDGWDVVMAVSESTAEVMIERVMEAIGDIKGSLSFTIPDPRAVADILVASAETISTFGRLGLGRRGLRSASSIRVEYSARTGRPNVCFLEGGRIALCRIPAHLTAKAHLEVEKFKGNMLDRLRSFILPSAEWRASKYEKVVVNTWDFDEDIVLERAEVLVKQEPKVPLSMEITSLDLELDLSWPLPNDLMEKIVEGMGKGIMNSLLPEVIPNEVPLPPEIPFKIKLGDLQVSTAAGFVIVRANIGMVPQGDADQVKQVLRERLTEVSPMLTKSPGTS